jgi:regulator of nonsense transcripts 2
LYNDSEDIVVTGGKWEDEEERKYYEDVQDLKDYVPSGVLGIDKSSEFIQENEKDKVQERIEQEKEEVRQLEEELQKLQNDHVSEKNSSLEESPTEEDDV